LTQDIEPPSTEPYARWCERTSSQLMAILLLDCTIEYQIFGHVCYIVCPMCPSIMEHLVA
ncbi:hypothetical protein EFT14_04475, partial [Staphylococcus pseudintermedius]|nr:hypothetical protein [Staphylococcus pseudintermedius]